MAKKNTKCRTWTFVLYPEDKGVSELLDYLMSDNIERVRGYYIIHQPRVKTNEEIGEPIINEETGLPEMTKQHIHVVVNFPNARSKDGVIKALCLFKDEVETDDNNNQKTVSKPIHVESVKDICSMYYYCLHWTYACKREGKEEYKESDIVKLGNDSVDFVLSCKGERDLTTRVTCAELLQKAEKSRDARELLMNCIDDEHHVKFMLKNPYFVKIFILGREEQ